MLWEKDRVVSVSCRIDRVMVMVQVIYGCIQIRVSCSLIRIKSGQIGYESSFGLGQCRVESSLCGFA